MTPRMIWLCITLPFAVMMSIMAIALAVTWTSPQMPDLEELETFMWSTAAP